MITITWILAILMLFGVAGIEGIKRAVNTNTIPKGTAKEELEQALEIYYNSNLGTKVFIIITVSGMGLADGFDKLCNIFCKDGKK
jgi:hypothetical protein